MPNADEGEERRGQGLCSLGPPLCSREGLGLSSSKSITHWATVASQLLPSLRPGICHLTSP